MRAKRSRKSSRVAWGMFILNGWILMCILLLVLVAKFAHEVLHVLCVELRLFPGHEVTTTRKLGKVYKVYLARSPFTRQRRIVGTMSDGCRNSRALP